MSKFKKGDLAKLKSGGPKMTVLNYRMSVDIAAIAYGGKAAPSVETKMVHCQWFDDKNKLTGNDFHEDILDLVE